MRLIAMLLICLASATAFAADGTTSAAVPAASPAASAPFSLEFGFDHRIRTENWNNILDYNAAADDKRDQLRFRTRAWTKVGFGDNVSVMFRLGNEFKKQFTPDVTLGRDEIVVENLYVDVQRLFTPKLSLRVGRQDLMRGEGFLLFEGNSGDGSRSFYFNAISLAYSSPAGKTELLAISNPNRDRFLPVWNDQTKYLSEWDEQALGLYHTAKFNKLTDADFYYFYKTERNDYRATSHAQYQPDRHVNTLGGRLARKLPRAMVATGEFGWQWGKQYPGNAVRGWGGYAHLRKDFAAARKPYVKVGYHAYSGDDPSTARVEGWDPLFSRWPKYSELYLYSYLRERGVGYTTNTNMLQLEAGLTPWKPLTVKSVYYRMDAAFAPAQASSLFSTGRHRGDNLQLRADYKISGAVNGHLLYEAFLPGSFYAQTARGGFFRAEISYNFKTMLAGGVRR